VAVLFLACAPTDEDPYVGEAEGIGESAVGGRIANLTAIARNPLLGVDPGLTLSAQFVDFVGLSRGAVRRSLDLWSPALHPQPEQCTLHLDGVTESEGDWYSNRVELLDAGTLEVTLGEETLLLEPRRMPEFLPYLRGVTYGTDGRQRPEYASGRELDFWSAGGDDVGGFEVALSLPEPIGLDYVDGVAVGSADTVDVDMNGPLLLVWSPTSASEVVYLVVEVDGPYLGPALTCTAYDDGAFRLSQAALDSLLVAAQRDDGSTSLRLVLRRARVTPVDLPGFDEAEAVAVTEHSIILY
jgi:hypothetical protein